MNADDARLKLKEFNQWAEDYQVKPEMYMADTTIVFDARYRVGLIWIHKQECMVCNKKKQCLIVDQSEGEYTQPSICFECLDVLKKANEE